MLMYCTEEITDSDIFVNCIYLTSKIPNFGEPQLQHPITQPSLTTRPATVNLESLQTPDRKLSVVCDVSAVCPFT